MGMLQEFKEFAMKGNLIDMAVGVVMGAAFGTVTKSFIDGMFMPIIGTIFQVGNLKDAKVILKQAVMEGEKVVSPESAILYGDFVSAIINFIIIAFVMFMIIKGINKMKKAKEESAPAGPSSTDALLMEIRDALKK